MFHMLLQLSKGKKLSEPWMLGLKALVANPWFKPDIDIGGHRGITCFFYWLSLISTGSFRIGCCGNPLSISRRLSAEVVEDCCILTLSNQKPAGIVGLFHKRAEVHHGGVVEVEVRREQALVVVYAQLLEYRRVVSGILKTKPLLFVLKIVRSGAVRYHKGCPISGLSLDTILGLT